MSLAAIAVARPASSARRRYRRPAKATIALPRVSDGWTRECVTIVTGAYDDALGGRPPGFVESYTGPVPPLDMSNVMMGATNLAFGRPGIAPEVLIDRIREAARFVGLA